ncbi:glycoside hydrolase family 3 protein [Lepidopterella palustris CBS 459.81]|uniref:beta-glucosidase n=1 Tax=Lepidopterella palustris CBS 459.81 TaxID=1314670 RepID=A0A8E2EC21_9PEZI|nr:glycoside hydrolase family 3 protein [Lepidopterella palustris CBS 459.81]
MLWLAQAAAILAIHLTKVGAAATLYPNATNPNPSNSTNASELNDATSPPYYPSPWMDGSGQWADAYTKAQDFVRQLTLLEKVNLTTGVGWEGEACVGNVGSIPRLGFRALCMQDSPLGVRFADYVSAFPAGGTVAASWDRGVWYQRGYQMGMEHRMKGVDVQLGPVVGPLGRSPEGGRNWEGFSPDPVLSGIAVSETIRGIQDAGVIACTKHYILNEQEHFRQPGDVAGYGFVDGISSNIDDKTLHELYLWPFADAVRAGTGSIMCSYNQVNNSYACQNSYLINYILKGELGFQGFVMSDWSAQHAGVSSSLAGLDMTMPGDTAFDTGLSFWGANLTIAVLNGTIPEWRLDDMATRIMAAYYLVGRDRTQVPVNFNSWSLDTYGYEHPYASMGYGLINQHVDVRAEHGTAIRSAAARSTVLLKNNNALPLSGKEKFTAVFGEDADNNAYGPNGCSDHGCDDGTLAQGWGSGTASFPYLVTPLAAIQNEVLQYGSIIQSVTNNWAYTQIEALAKQASVALVFVNADSGEGYITVDGNEGDRNNLTLWKDGDALIKNVTGYCNNTVVVIHSVGPVLVDAWYNNPNVTAILWAGLPGEQSGNSIADVLYGRVNPGGKLTFTMGASRTDYGTDIIYKPPNGHAAPQDNFDEGVFIDYRYFDKNNIDPIYEFGFGLSYTTFAYSNINVIKASAGAYTPTTGMTLEAPVLGNYSTNPADYQFPSNMTYVTAYIYPYLNSTDLSKASEDSSYGLPTEKYIPAGATDGSPQPRIAAGGGPGGNPELWDVLFTVTATIANNGTIPGEEVVQMYVSLGGPDDPKVVLRGFERLSIQAGSSATFTADITRRDLSNWDTATQNWFISSYPKTVYVGSSSRKLLLSSALNI